MKQILQIVMVASLWMQTSSAQMYSPDTAWDWACQWTEYSCEGVERPEFVIKDLDGARGTYSDGVIYLSQYLHPGADMQSTAIHEMVHHLQSVVADRPSFAAWFTPEMEMLCEDEAEAFVVTDKWWRAVGMSGQQRGPDWWFTYPHCHEYYDPDFYEGFDEFILDLIEEF